MTKPSKILLTKERKIMKKTLMRTLAFATLALTLVFTAATSTEAANDGIMTLSDAPLHHVTKH